MSELLSVEDAWARLAVHIDWADRFWVAFLFTDDPRVIEALGQRVRVQLEAAGRGFELLRPTGSEEIDELFETLRRGRSSAVAWVDLVRHDTPAQPWQAAWERLLLKLNERRELLRRRWSKGGLVFATTLGRHDETPALAPDLWTIRAMTLRVASQPAETDALGEARITGERTEVAERAVARRSSVVRSSQLARQAVERARKRDDDLGQLEALVTLARAEAGEDSLTTAHEARVLAERLLEERTSDEDRFRIASSLAALADVLERGQVTPAREALELTHKAVEILRPLAHVNPDFNFLIYLAPALDDLGKRLSSLGQDEDAMVATKESVEIRRKLAQGSSGVFLPDLASGLVTLGARLSALGRQQEAIAATQEAVEISKKLAQARPDEFLPDLAFALHDLGAHLHSLGQREEAITATQEAVEILRKLVQASPDAFLDDLASALDNLGMHLSSLGRQEEAMAVTQEAVEIRKQLAEPSSDD